MTYISLLKKIYNLYEKTKLKKYKVKENIYYKKGEKNLNEVKKILLFFPYYEFMHFGDHFFFEPLARFLIESGFEVEIMPIEKMKFHFTKLNYTIGSFDKINEYDLIITRPEFINKTKDFKNSLIFINIAYNSINKPLCSDLVYKLDFLLNINKANKFKAVPLLISEDIDIKEKFGINPEEKYVIYNNYVDSASFRITKRKLERLENFLVKYSKDNNLKILHLGSQNDKEQDSRIYGFVELDLRGKTSLEELINLCNHKSVDSFVGFDTFIMHIFFILRKKTYIMFRGRFLKKNRIFIKKFVLPPFYYDKKNEKIIEFIE